MQKFHVNKERNPRTVLQHSSGVLLFFYSGKLHQPKRRLKKMQITPCEHLLPVAGVGEQQIDCSILFNVFVLKNFQTEILARNCMIC